MGFVETSAKSGANIEFAFKKIVEGTYSYIKVEILRQIQHNKSSNANIFASEVGNE